ncbi:MAG: hypothetical protein IPJ82_21080 [Lewinellaceae bacterium]|nr:hypothetical protein [Lewinellaceae bacterium]
MPATLRPDPFDDVRPYREDEKSNLLDFPLLRRSSGKRWFGDYFSKPATRPTMIFPTSWRVLQRGRGPICCRCGMSPTTCAPDRRLARDFFKNILRSLASNNDAAFAALRVMSGQFSPDGDQVNLTKSNS